METALCEEIRRFVRESSGNRFTDGGTPYFDEPLVGFAAADDPLFSEYKGIIGDFHQTPQEVMTSTFGGDARARTVICWAIPIGRATRESNRREKEWPSREWALTRTHGESFNMELRRHVVAWLESRGHRAVAPQLASDWRQLDDSPVGIASTWSERHALYAAGLGTFSLNDGFITDRGIAHRCGSVVTDLTLSPTPRKAPHHLHNCLHHRDGSCGICIDRCPTAALSIQGHDKAKCRDYVYVSAPAAIAEAHGVPQTGCGLCQTGVPCEAAAPRGKRR